MKRLNRYKVLYLIAIVLLSMHSNLCNAQTDNWRNRSDSTSCKMNFELNGTYSVVLSPNPFYLLDQIFPSQNQTEMRIVLIEVTFFNERIYVSDIRYMDAYNNLEKLQIESIIRTVCFDLENEPRNSTCYSANYPYKMIFKLEI
jgi:hypothetical protein